MEMVWNHRMYGELAHVLPQDVDDVQRAVTAALDKMGAQTQLIRSFFQSAGLELELFLSINESQ